MTTVTVGSPTTTTVEVGSPASTTVSVSNPAGVTAQVSTLNLEDLVDTSGYTLYTPTLQFDANPVVTADFGDGARAMQRGAYVNVGPLTFFTFRFEWDGSGISTPSGTAFLQLPTYARDDMDVIRVGMGTMFDASAGELYVAQINGGDLNDKLGLPPGTVPTNFAVVELVGQSFDGTLSHNSPWAGAADGDILHGSGFYWRDV